MATILQRVPAKHLVHLYRITPFSGAEDMLAQIAHARGKLLRGGLPNVQTAARIVLQDWNDGRIAYFTRPPERASAGEGSAEVVAQFAAEFDTDAVYGVEARALVAAAPAAGATDFAEVASAGPQQVRKWWSFCINDERILQVHA